MPYVPLIRDYKPFYIQTSGDLSAWDTTTYGLVAQTQPFPENYEVKDPYKNDWKDEHGDDEYVVQLFFKAFEYTVKFFIKTYPDIANGKSAVAVMNGLRDSFREKIFPGEFKIWDSWQEKGYRKVRYVKEVVDDRHVCDEYAWMIFSVTFKVNDPDTGVIFSNNVISAL